MASNSEYEQQRTWKRGWIEEQVLEAKKKHDAELEHLFSITHKPKKAYFSTVTGISGVDVNLFKDKELNQKQ